MPGISAEKTNDDTVGQSSFERTKEEHLIGSRDCVDQVPTRNTMLSVLEERRSVLRRTDLFLRQGASTRRPVLFPV